MQNRTQITITANDKTYNIGHTVAENVTVEHSIAVVTDDCGRMTARPVHHVTTVHRTVNRRDGKFLLMQVAIASQRFNLQAMDAAKHPKAVVTEKLRRGNQWIDFHRSEFADFQPSDYSFVWTGSGNDGLHGCTIHESITLLSTSGSETELGANVPRPFNLA